MNLNPHRYWIWKLSGPALGACLGGALIFAPWAFGTTQPWAMTMLNGFGYAAGLWVILRHLVDRRNPRPRLNFGVAGLCACNLLLLAYELIALLNAASTYDPATRAMLPREHWQWLPASIDPQATGWMLQRDLALTGFFWATRLWLQGAGSGWRSGGLNEHASPDRRRLGQLVWLLVINGFLLAVVGLVQRETAQGKLLWLIEPEINKAPTAQFGPYAYRSNAMQYLSMIWPLGLGWWARHQMRSKSAGRGATFRVLPAFCLMIIGCLFLSWSRTAALVGAVGLIATVVIFTLPQQRARVRGLRWIVPSLLITLAISLWVGRDWMELRIVGEGIEDRPRELLRESGWNMLRDNPVFGTGPGTFRTAHQLYRAEGGIWYGQMHCDYLEILGTFGVLGASPMLIGVLVVLLGLLRARGQRDRLFGCFITLALGGCLVHAWVDFPFQIYSIVHLFVTLCAAASTLGWAPALDRRMAITSGRSRRTREVAVSPDRGGRADWAAKV